VSIADRHSDDVGELLNRFDQTEVLYTDERIRAQGELHYYGIVKIKDRGDLLPEGLQLLQEELDGIGSQLSMDSLIKKHGLLVAIRGTKRTTVLFRGKPLFILQRLAP
jgi:hypothetical protein